MNNSTKLNQTRTWNEKYKMWVVVKFQDEVNETAEDEMVDALSKIYISKHKAS
jgi:hypothetical protein